jgi:hypothetical protein
MKARKLAGSRPAPAYFAVAVRIVGLCVSDSANTIVITASTVIVAAPAAVRLVVRIRFRPSFACRRRIGSNRHRGSSTHVVVKRHSRAVSVLPLRKSIRRLPYHRFHRAGTHPDVRVWRPSGIGANGQRERVGLGVPVCGRSGDDQTEHLVAIVPERNCIDKCHVGPQQVPDKRTARRNTVKVGTANAPDGLVGPLLSARPIVRLSSS